MKAIISILIIFLVLTGCDKVNVETKPTEYIVASSFGALQLVTIDGCEYLYGAWGNATVLTHKGNCINSSSKTSRIISHTYAIGNGFSYSSKK